MDIEAHPVSGAQALQNGGHSHAEIPAKSKRLDGQDWKDAYFMVKMAQDRDFLKLQWKDKTYHFN